ncbi:MAG: NUDIX domain-containing protein [Rhodobacteraceae bacterium]|nr:NUDIX domain-containing protein [Paracoccaceae bacterium]
MQIFHKAYVYLTCGSRLLVFNEPDNPDLGLQVPGGTIDPGESYLIGARREFQEETGLELDAAFDLFAEQDLPFETLVKEGKYKAPPGRPLKGQHFRKYYHVRIDEVPEEEWTHYEMTPSSGGDPILYRLFWLDLFDKTALDREAFHAAFGDPLDALRTKL